MQPNQQPPSPLGSLPGPLLELGMRAQLESLYAEREYLAAELGVSDADEVLAVVEGLRAESASLRRLIELTEAQRRLDAERQAVSDEIERLRSLLPAGIPPTASTEDRP